MQGMGLLDILIWILLLLFIVKGFMKGLVREICSLAGLIAGGWLAFRFYTPFSTLLRPIIHLPPAVAGAVSFLLIFLLIILISYLAGHLLTAFTKVMLLGGINRAGGVLFGAFEGALVICMTLYLLTAKPVPETLKKQIHHSPTGSAFARAGREIVGGWEGKGAGDEPVPTTATASPAGGKRNSRNGGNVGHQ